MFKRVVKDVNPLLYAKKKTLFDTGDCKYLPEAYKKFYIEWREGPKEPVHYIPKEGRYERDSQTGEVKRIYNIPISTFVYTPEMHKILGGGEQIIFGYKKRNVKANRVPHFWIPRLIDAVVYSEILNKHMKVIAAPRAIKKINEHFGLDNYILETDAANLQNFVALKLKRKLLKTLLEKSLYPEDSNKREEVYNKYKKHLEHYTPEEIEWYGLTIYEALDKLRFLREQEQEKAVVPLKIQFRKELVDKLKTMSKEELEEEEPSWWRKKLFPF